MDNKLNFFLPIDSIEKSKDKDGNEVMKIKGVASTNALDSQGEILEPSGFELKKFLKSGFFNWQHQATKTPNAIIGEPTKAFIKNNEMHVEGVLYPSNPIAKSVYNIAKTLQKDSKTRSLGYSIEGNVIERDPNNPKRITKSSISHVAICTQPINPRTVMEVMKGEVDSFEEFEYDEELMKAMEAGSVTGTDTTDQSLTQEPLKEESLEGKKKKKDAKVKNNIDKNYESMTKGEIYIEIFGKFTKDIKKAKEIYSLVEKISQMGNETEVTLETIKKAHDILDMASGATEDTSADASNLDALKKSVDDAKEVLQKAESEMAAAAPKVVIPGENTKVEGTKEEKQDGEGSPEGGEVTNSQSMKSMTPDIVKGITDSLGPKFAALGELFKAQEEDLKESKDLIKGQGVIITKLGERLNLVEKQKPARKAIHSQSFVSKGDDSSQLGGGTSTEYKTLSQSINKAELVNVLFDASIKDGKIVNEVFAKASANLEASGVMAGSEIELDGILKGLRNEFNIEVTQ